MHAASSSNSNGAPAAATFNNKSVRVRHTEMRAPMRVATAFQHDETKTKTFG
jgi:hypothetical protein